MSSTDPEQPRNHMPAPPGGWIDVPEPEQPAGQAGAYGYGQYGYSQPAYQRPGWAGMSRVGKPSSGLVYGILVTVLCCLPLGIVSIIYAAQVDSKWNMGDYHGAQRAARLAKNWALAGVIAGLIFTVIYVLIVLDSGLDSTTRY